MRKISLSRKENGFAIIYSLLEYENNQRVNGGEFIFFVRSDVSDYKNSAKYGIFSWSGIINAAVAVQRRVIFRYAIYPPATNEKATYFFTSAGDILYRVNTRRRYFVWTDDF